MSTLLEYRLRLRDAGNTTDSLVISSVRGDTLPWLASPPTGDGLEFDPLTGQSRAGSFTGRIVDGITSGTNRVVTANLEDAGLRQQLMDRRAFVEFRQNGGSWSVLIAGFLTRLSLVTGITYEYTVSDPTMSDGDYMAFAPKAGTNPDNLENVATYLARWPNRGCIFGGPVTGGFLQQADRKGFEMQAVGQTSGVTYLKFVAGYAPPKFTRSTNATDCFADANRLTDGVFTGPAKATSSITTFEDANGSGWPGVIIEVIGVGFFQPNHGLLYSGSGAENLTTDGLYAHLLKTIRSRGIFVTATTISTGSTVLRVRAYTAQVSEMSPIYWTGHPVDLIAALWTEAGRDFSTTAIDTVRHTLGDDLRVAFRITEPQKLTAWLQANLLGPFGIGVRSNDLGQLETFAARDFPNTLPSVTITAADVQLPADSAAPPAFYVDRSVAIKTVTFQHTRLVMTQDSQGGGSTHFVHGAPGGVVNGPTSSSPDGFLTVDEFFSFTNRDAGGVGNASQDYVVAGMVYQFNAAPKDSSNYLYARITALAATVFDRYGRGLVQGELVGLRGGSTDTVRIGDEILNNLPQLPNHNKRLGEDLSVAARAMQVVRITPGPSGPAIKLADSGPAANPFATVPTLSLAASGSLPRVQALLTITNAAALNTAGAGVRVQIAVTTGAAAASTAYTDVLAYSAGQIPTGAIALPKVTSGNKLFVQARAEKSGSRPSNYSSPISLALTAIPSISALAASSVAGDGSTELAGWTVGDTTSAIDVYLRASGAPSSDAIRINVLPPGSNQYLIEGLTPGSAYTFGVQPRDEGTGDVAVVVEVTFTAGATTRTLAAPVDPAAFSGSTDPLTGNPKRDGLFGIAVLAAEYPGFVEVQVAVETAVGSGTYGALATSGTLIPSVSGNWTIWQDTAPNDGLRRQLQARHVAIGSTASAYTTVVTATPWTPVALAAISSLGSGIIVEVTMLTSSFPGGLMKFSVTGIDPAGGTPQVKIVSLGFSTGIASGPSVGVASPNGQIWVISQPAPGQGPSSVVVAAFVGSNLTAQTIVIPEATTLAQPQGTVSIDANGNWEATADGSANTNSFRYSFSTSAYPADATVASSGTLVSGPVRTFSINSISPLTFGQTVFITIIPFTQTGGGGAQLPSMHIRGSYLTYTASKTLTWYRAGWQDITLKGYTTDTSDNVQNVALTSGSIRDIFRMVPAVPRGVQLVSASFDCSWVTATNALNGFTVRVDANGTTVNFGSPTYGAGGQTVTFTLGSTTVSSGAVSFQSNWTAPFANADAAQAAIGDVSITYTMPTPDKTV
jgi:hypothetical protein